MSDLRPYFSLTKPRVVVLLQITALCSVLVHDQLGGGLDANTARTVLVVFVGRVPERWGRQCDQHVVRQGHRSIDDAHEEPARACG